MPLSLKDAQRKSRVNVGPAYRQGSDGERDAETSHLWERRLLQPPGYSPAPKD